MTEFKTELLTKILDNITRLEVLSVNDENVLKAVNEAGVIDVYRKVLRERITDEFFAMLESGNWIKHLQLDKDESGYGNGVVVRSWMYVISQERLEKMMREVLDVIEKYVENENGDYF